MISWDFPKMMSRRRPNLTSKGRPWKVDSGRSLDVLSTSPRGPSKHVFGTMWDHLLDVTKFLFTFLSELIRLTKFDAQGVFKIHSNF